ncbi:MAG TPA: glutamate racemase [Candidatus Dormibacteraeota bacterium]|nr:glutamate racemase [Candidatus Dormibacteraeota bacterium]
MTRQGSGSDDRPIGVFDSGVGGLTVLRELDRRLPDERLVYLADLAHFPYGPRYQAQVRDLALRIVEHLVALDVKLVVIACNTATAAGLHACRERFDVPVVGVIAPGAQAAVEATRNGRVAVISTEGTHASKQYLDAMWEANPGVGILPRAAPGLVEIVEAGAADSPEAEEALRPIIREVVDWGADTLVLGCTHYPLLRGAISRVAGDGLTIVDSARSTAQRVERILDVNRLRRTGGAPERPRLLVTADPARFAAAAEMLFGESLGDAEVVPLWNPGLEVVAS